MLEIVTYPDERLRKKALPVEEVNDDIRRLVDDMAATMYANSMKEKYAQGISR